MVYTSTCETSVNKVVESIIGEFTQQNCLRYITCMSSKIF